MPSSRASNAAGMVAPPPTASAAENSSQMDARSCTTKQHKQIGGKSSHVAVPENTHTTRIALYAQLWAVFGSARGKPVRVVFLEAPQTSDTASSKAGAGQVKPKPSSKSPAPPKVGTLHAQHSALAHIGTTVQMWVISYLARSLTAAGTSPRNPRAVFDAPRCPLGLFCAIPAHHSLV